MIRKILTYLIILSLFAFVKANAQNVVESNLGFKLPEGRSQYTLPFEVVNNLIIVKVVLNNTLPLKFIVDTGVRTSILTDKTFSDILNISYARKITIPGAGGEKLVDAYIAPNVTLDIEGVVGHGHAILVLEEDLLELKNFLGKNVQGILGFELFSRFIVDINYQGRIMTLYEPEAFEKRNFEKKKKYLTIPITVEDTKPYCYADIEYYDGKKLRAKFMIDTGATHAVLLDTNSDEKIEVPAPFIPSHLGRGLAGDITGKIARLKHVDFEQFQFDDVIATFPDKEYYIQGFDKVYRNGTLGGEILSRFRVIFNFIDGYLYLKKNRRFKSSFDYNMSGVVIKAEGLYLNTFKILEVRENSAADKANVKAGDIILSINNSTAHNLKLNEINGIFNSKANRVIKLELLRDGKVIQTKFKLERLI